MASSREHYATVLTPVYSWMLGGFANALNRNAEFFERHGISPRGSGLAVDLGAGCGFQSIPLARLGYDVVAIDLDRQLLDEMMSHAEGLRIRPIEDDLLRFTKHLTRDIELAICMTDTLLHLESRDDARQLIGNVFDALEHGGKLILSFRDLTHELVDLERFIPVRSDSETVFTCFLEYERETVKVHDLVHRKVNGQWKFAKSFYRKLRLAKQWVVDEARGAGFSDVQYDDQNGLVTLIATKGGSTSPD